MLRAVINAANLDTLSRQRPAVDLRQFPSPMSREHVARQGIGGSSLRPDALALVVSFFGVFLKCSIQIDANTVSQLFQRGQ